MDYYGLLWIIFIPSALLFYFFFLYFDSPQFSSKIINFTFSKYHSKVLKALFIHLTSLYINISIALTSYFISSIGFKIRSLEGKDNRGETTGYQIPQRNKRTEKENLKVKKKKKNKID